MGWVGPARTVPLRCGSGWSLRFEGTNLDPHRCRFLRERVGGGAELWHAGRATRGAAGVGRRRGQLWRTSAAGAAASAAAASAGAGRCNGRAWAATAVELRREGCTAQGRTSGAGVAASAAPAGARASAGRQERWSRCCAGAGRRGGARRRAGQCRRGAGRGDGGGSGGEEGFKGGARQVAGVKKRRTEKNRRG